MTTDQPQRLTVDEAAVIARESAFTIRKRCRDGVLPAAKRGGVWWIRRVDLDTYMAPTNQDKAPAEKPQRFLTADLKRRQRASADPRGGGKTR